MIKFQNILMIFALILAVSLYGCKNSGVPSSSVETSGNHKQETPKGVKVWTKNGATLEQLNQIDAGISQAFADGIASGWPVDGNYGKYRVYFPAEPCVLSPISHIPSFSVRGDNYDGSVYDHWNTLGELPLSQQTSWAKYYPDGIGKVYASEMVMTYSTQSGYSSFVVCPDELVLKNGSNYGAEHTLAFDYDRAYYQVTATHNTVLHPILPKRILGKNSVEYKGTLTPLIEAVE